MSEETKNPIFPNKEWLAFRAKVRGGKLTFAELCKTLREFRDVLNRHVL